MLASVIFHVVTVPLPFSAVFASLCVVSVLLVILDTVIVDLFVSAPWVIVRDRTVVILSFIETSWSVVTVLCISSYS